MRVPRFLIAFLIVGTIALLVGCANGPRSSNQEPATIFTSAKHESRSEPQQQAPSVLSESPVLQAQDGGSYTLEAAVQRAVDWHPAVAETIGRLQQQTEAVSEARSGYLPRLSWGVDSTYDNSRADRYSPMFSVSGSQMIYDFGKVAGRVKVASAGVEGRRSQILMAVDDLARETASAVIEIQRNRALRIVARDQIKDTTSILNLVRSRTNRGASTRSDQLQAEARVQAAEAALLEIDGQLRRWEGVLAALTGTIGQIDVARGVPAWLSSACNPGEIDWSLVPAVMQAEAERSAATAQIDLSRAEGLPTLSLDGKVASDIARVGSIDPEYRIGFNVTGSIYNGGETSARRRAAAHALGTSQAAAARARVDIQRSLLEARGQIESMERLKLSLTKRQSMMRETRDLYRTQYVELGTRTLLDLLNADQELHGTRFDATNIDYDLHRLNIDCTFNTGRMRDAFSLKGRHIQGISL